MNVPTLAVFADHSRLASLENMRFHLMNLELLELQGTGHLLMIEKSAEFNHLLLDFLHRQTF
jgi:pimeloyl-ACP methyl ester carboxylesterase